MRKTKYETQFQIAAVLRSGTGGRYAPVTMCVGVGQGVATVLERV
jgi:acetyl-CoA acetyltransferase